jgi:hypothetical protein
MLLIELRGGRAIESDEPDAGMREKEGAKIIGSVTSSCWQGRARPEESGWLDPGSGTKAAA